MKDLIDLTISSFLHWGEKAAIACNLSLPLTTRGEACKEIFKDSPGFWEAVAQMIAPQPKSEPVLDLDSVVNPLSSKSKTKPVPAQPTEEPARKVNMTSPPKKRTRPTVTNNTMADQLRGPAKELGFKDRSLMEQFRDHFSVKGKGADYWRTCRELAREVLQTEAIKDTSDWEILAVKISWNIFFTDQRTTAPFIKRCPKEVLTDLLLAEKDGLWRQVEKIRQETSFNRNSPDRIKFVMDCCLAVGKEASGLLENCKHAVNRMKQKKFIPAEHWLVQKVARMSRSKKTEKSLPEEPKESLKSEPEPGVESVVNDRQVDQVQEMAEATVDATELEGDSEQKTPQTDKPVAQEEAPVPAEATPVNGKDKPKSLDSAFESFFEKRMLEGDGEKIDPDSMPEDELDRLTAPNESSEEAKNTGEAADVPSTSEADVSVEAEPVTV